MIEVLFRGRPNDGSCGVFGDLIHRRICKYDIVVIRTEDSGFDNYNEYEVFPETVGQYTGLTDKNGQKIFEGDIFRELDGGMDNIPRMVCWDERHLKWKCPLVKKHWAYGYNDCSLWMIHGEKIEVIGNIHDNSELLEGADNG